MMNANEMLAHIEKVLKDIQLDIENERKQDYPDRRKLHEFGTVQRFIENIFGHFKFGPREEVTGQEFCIRPDERDTREETKSEEGEKTEEKDS